MPDRAVSADEQAVERYRYMLRTAPPEDIERAHEEAFANLTPDQRRMVLEGLSKEVPESERRAASDDPRSLARLATRAEMRQPGTLERTFSGMGGYGGGGGMGIGGWFLTTMAASFVGTAIAQSFFANDANYGEGYAEGYQEGQQDAEGGSAEGGDYGSEAGLGEHGYGEDPGTADYGGDFGGGDFGGGDFGGGDFGGGEI